MVRLKDVVQWKTVSDAPLKVGDATLTPQSQALTIRWPYGGLVWNRPVAVLVERGAQTEHIPVVDVTRAVQLGLLGLSLIFLIATVVMSVRRRRVRS